MLTVGQFIPAWESGLHFRTFTTSINSVHDIIASSLTFFEGLFDVPYSLPKLDWVAIPDFPAGGMENWGLILSQEGVIQLSKADSNSGDLLRSWHILPHEISHNWFGNLVTLTWWGEVLLNEGFAAYLEQIGAEHAKPSDGFDQRVFVKIMKPALQTSQEPWWPLPVVTQGSDFTSFCGGFTGTPFQIHYNKVRCKLDIFLEQVSWMALIL